MCLPLVCINKVLGYSSILLLIVSLGGVGFSGYLIGIDNDFWKNQKDVMFKASSLALLIFSGFLTLVSIFGIIGGFKKGHGCYKICNCLFLVGILPLFLALLLIAIIVQALLNGQLSSLDKMRTRVDCGTEVPENLKWIKDIDTMYKKGYQAFGHDDKCPILIPNDDFKKKFDPSYLIDKFSQDDKVGKFNIQSCYKFNIKDEEMLYKLMGFVERKFKCSGMCKENNDKLPFRQYYLFADSKQMFHDSFKDLEKNQGCLNSIYDMMNKFGKVIYITGYALSAFLLINIVLTVCKCCHPDFKKQEGNVYQKF